MTQLRLDAAFRSSRANECYLFVKNKVVVVNYVPGGKKDELLSGPVNISDAFPILKNTPFAIKIDCALTTDGNEVFLFAGNQCCRIDYVPNRPRQARILEGPSPIVSIFPYLKDTVFVNGVDAALFTACKHVFLFKGDMYARINYQARSLVSSKSISTAFTSWVGTVFQNGIDSAFNSHIRDEAYIFRGKYWARINFAPDTASNDFIVGGRIKLISDDWTSLSDILNP